MPARTASSQPHCQDTLSDSDTRSLNGNRDRAVVNAFVCVEVSEQEDAISRRRTCVLHMKGPVQSEERALICE